MKLSRQALCLLLALLLSVACAGCTLPPAPDLSLPSSTKPAPPTEAAAALPAETSAGTAAAALRWEPSDPERGPMPEYGVSWQEIFWNRRLPENGFLLPDEVAFYFCDAENEGSVLVLTQDELLERVAALGSLPRTRFFEDLLDQRFTVLFACFDLATELGCGMFCFPTRELRAWDVTDVKFYFSYSFSTFNGSPNYSVTKDLRDEEGAEFRYMTVQMTKFNDEDYRKYAEAMVEARRIVSGLSPELSQLEKAKALYSYVSSTVRYDFNNYYEETDWSTLYDALIKKSTVCTGYAEAIYCLFNLAGIDCLYLSGSVVAADHSSDFHAWNEARLGENWYIFDATWDASLLEYDLGSDRFAFFGLSDEFSDRYAVRKPWPFMASVAPACGEILDPDCLQILPVEEP